MKFLVSDSLKTPKNNLLNIAKNLRNLINLRDVGILQVYGKIWLDKVTMVILLKNLCGSALNEQQHKRTNYLYIEPLNKHWVAH